MLKCDKIDALDGKLYFSSKVSDFSSSGRMKRNERMKGKSRNVGLKNVREWKGQSIHVSCDG